MLSPSDKEMKFGHCLDQVGSSYVVKDDEGRVIDRTGSETRALRELRKARSAWLRGRNSRLLAAPVAGRIGVA